MQTSHLRQTLSHLLREGNICSLCTSLCSLWNRAWGSRHLEEAGRGFLGVLTLTPLHSTQGSSPLGPLRHAGHRPHAARHLLLPAAAPGCHRAGTAPQGQSHIPHPNQSEDAAVKAQPRTRLGTPCSAGSTHKPGSLESFLPSHISLSSMGPWMRKWGEGPETWAGPAKGERRALHLAWLQAPGSLAD